MSRRRTPSVIRKQRKRNIDQAEELEKELERARTAHREVLEHCPDNYYRQLAMDIICDRIDELRVKLAKKEVTIEALTRELRGEMRIG